MSIHQVAFGVRSGRGLGPVAASFSVEDDAVRGWLLRLEHHIRLKGLLDRPAPGSALSHVDLGDGRCAVVMRWNTPGASGRNNSHALIGSADLLRAPGTAGLRDWRWPADVRQDERLPVIAEGEVLEAVEQGVARLGDAANDLPEHLAPALLARLLDNPGSPVCVKGCPDEHRLPLLWLTYAASAGYLRHHGQGRSWTFSTYETEMGSDAPDVVFSPGDSALGDRIIVDLDAPVAASAEAVELADTLLLYARSGQAIDPAALPEPPGRRRPAGVTDQDLKNKNHHLVRHEHPTRRETGPSRRGVVVAVSAAALVVGLVIGLLVGRSTAPQPTPTVAAPAAQTAGPSTPQTTSAPPQSTIEVPSPRKARGQAAPEVYLWRIKDQRNLTAVEKCQAPNDKHAWVCKIDPDADIVGSANPTEAKVGTTIQVGKVTCIVAISERGCPAK